MSDTAALARRLDAARPDAIINAAAYTAVDRAESEPALAWCVNAEAPATLARAAQHLGVPLVHVSTDDVFDGSQAGGYVESDPVGPLNAYGRSKLGGELAVASLCKRHWILRTSWVFSEHGHNFAKTMLRLALEHEELRIVDDQRGRPTYAGDLADCIVQLLGASARGKAPPTGVHHVGGGAVVSWKQFALFILERAVAAGLVPRVPRIVGIATTEYPTPAARPRNSVLLTRDATVAFTRDPFDWEHGVESMLVAMRTGLP